MKSLQEIKDEYAMYRYGYKDWNTFLKFNLISNEDLDCIAKLYSDELYNKFKSI